MRESARRSGGFAIRRQKRLDLFIADLQSAAVGFSCLLWAFSLEADCKSALNRSSLFCLRIANPQGRLAGLRLTLAPGGVASHPCAWRGCVSPFRLAGLRLTLSPGGGCVSSARRSGGFAIRRQKRLDLFIADLQSAAVGFSCLLWAFSLEADCKSALNRSSLFCLRIANPQGRLAGLRLTLSPSGVASLPFAWRGCVSPLRLAGLRLSLAPGGVASHPFAWRGCVSPFRLAGLRLSLSPSGVASHPCAWRGLRLSICSLPTRCYPNSWWRFL